MLVTAVMDTEEEPSSMLWGLDPVFSAFARLYVKDILEMKESCQVPGIYFYNTHPIFKVDVLGTVVYKREREDFFCYGVNGSPPEVELDMAVTLVDDGTGVINCLCWKNELFKKQDEPASARPTGATHGGFNPMAELEKLREAQRSSCCLEIGELLRVRGPVKTSRQQREIMASTFYKVDDPMMAVQIERMMEVLQLYRQCYDKPFQLEADSTGSAISRLSQAASLLKNFLKEKNVIKFRPYDVQDLLQPLVSNQRHTDSSDQPVAGPSSCQQLRQLLKDTLQHLQDEGIVFLKVKGQDQVFHVTEQDKDLFMVTKDIIREDCKRERYAEKGCHVLHILSAVRQRYSPNVSRVVLESVLASLECNSDIISTSDNYFTIL